MKTLLTVLVLCALAVPLPAQIIVDPNGGGHYTDLQPAIDAASSGQWVRVINYGLFKGPIRIDKDLTLIDASIEFGQVPGSDEGLVLNSSGLVTLIGVRVTGIEWRHDPPPKPASVAGTCDHLRIIDCWITGADPTTQGPSVPAVDTQARRVTVIRSTLSASHECLNVSGLLARGGAPALIAPRATVVLLDSTIVGGNSGARSATFSNPCPNVGTGGDGVVANEVFVADTTITPGKGTEAWNFWNTILWCTGPNGTAIRASSVTYLPAGYSAGSMRLGTRWSMTFPTFPGEGVMIVAAQGNPLRVAGLLVFIDPTTIVGTLTVPANASSQGFMIPFDTALVGAPIAVQVYEPSIGMGRPILDTISF